MNIKSLALGATLGLGAAGVAHAEVVEVFDLQDPATLVSGRSPETFDLTYNTSGWASIESATLFLWLGDDDDPESEWALAGAFGEGNPSPFVPFGTLIPEDSGWYSLGSVLSLVALGKTSLTGAVFGIGDFFYGGAKVAFNVTLVPEASELWMLGAGLMAVGGIAVKRRSLGQV